MKRRKVNETHSVEDSSHEQEIDIKDHVGKCSKEFADEPISQSEMILEQDRFLPIANISRIMKRVIPSEGKLSKESKECVQECITEFLLFITSEASEKCSTEKRKTITGEDLIVAFHTLGFDEYVEPMKEFLHKYRDANKLHTVKTEEPAMVNQSIVDHNIAYISTDQPIAQAHDSQMSQQLQPTQSVASTSSSVNLKESQSPPFNTAPSTLQPMQVFFDPDSHQHYLAVQGSDGVQQLLPVNLSHASG